MRAFESAIDASRAPTDHTAQPALAPTAAHRAFVVEKLALSGAALTAAPFFLVYRGVPTPLEASVFALALLQIVAATIVAKAGHFATGQAVAVFGFLGIAATFAFGVPGGVLAGLAWSIVAALEALSARGGRTSMAFGASAAAVAILSLVGAPIEVPPTSGTIYTAGVAIVCALMIGVRIVTTRTAAPEPTADVDARSDALMSLLDDPMVGFDADGIVDRVTRECEDLLGVESGALAGRGLFEQIHVADRPAFMKLVADALHEGGRQSARLRLRAGTVEIDEAGRGEPRYLTLEMRARRIEVLDDATGSIRVDGVVAAFRDVSDDRVATARPDALASDAGTDNRSRDEFLANMSHELRTPLNAIIGFSEMLASQTIRPVEESKQREYARIIHQSGQHLLSVVNSILDMSKIQSGTFALFPETFDVVQLVDQCCDMMRLKAQSGRVEVVRDVSGPFADVLGDRRACKQILINLLSNAIKFTPQDGRVTLRLQAEGPSLRISVEDTGIGIARADLSKLCDPFFQVRSSISRPYEGTGLGLSVVRGLIDLHGGSLAIDSELGEGTTVTVRLPFDRRSAEIVGLPRATADRRRGPDAPRLVEIDPSIEPRMKQIA